ncbi:MAG: hypothetical protein RXO26_08605 [Caldivirga sp.]|uniref:hypothetical protein n=1 Tax=Caldivirga sp. MU80 TaxID=1650354 RepID=UPI00083485A8|nr:hypothetical protein [Caldivirga sp. MU80]MDT7902546.1 hypothetical protein [Caldivirga sp.]NAZ28123.1 hypothetical protein [Caldivirga sp.]
MERRLRLPPRIKVLEALSAIADGRVRREGDHYVIVSSDGSRSYTVYVDEGRGLVYSNDNGTVYRGYVGYPIMSVLMMLGKLSFDKELSDGLRGIPWRELNEKFKNYNAVMEVIRGRVGEDKWPLYERFIDKVLGELRRLNLRLMERSTG